ncbi:Uncharacterised protein [Kluyvera cryocrescens]|uniref:Uncharacterized protein n=1 Tax=Kluyvera cryocrescens TaxID=580 RepID=A0A485CWN7_KLUCR|nr:Uncharacterised protein [Kluyvera cryocrescens]
MIDVTSSATVHCRLFFTSGHGLYYGNAGIHGDRRGRIAVQQEQERSPWRIPVIPGFNGRESTGIAPISSHSQRRSTHWKVRNCSKQKRHQGRKLLPTPMSP